MGEQMRRSLAMFFCESWHVLEPGTPLEWSKHHDAICLHFEVMILDWLRHRADPSHVQRIRELVANVPPGSAKSRIVMVALPAWVWTFAPWWRVLCASGNPRVALRDAVYCRQLITSDWYRRHFAPRWTLRQDQDAKGLYANTEGGFRAAMGIESTPVGERAHCLLLDDPNDADKVLSKVYRDGVNERFDLAWDNRRNDMRTDPLGLIMQRTHEQDLSGHLLATRPGIVHLRIPTEFEASSPCVTPLWRDWRTAEGESIHPERVTADVIAAERRKGSYYFAGQHQQRPAPAGGGMFKRSWWRFWKRDGLQVVGTRPVGCDGGPARPRPARFDSVTLSLDAAFKGHDEADFVVFTVWGKVGADRYLIDYRRGRWDYPQTRTVMRELAAAYPNARKLVEDKANGPAIIADLCREIAGLVAVNPEGGKEARAAAISPQVESGNVFLQDGASYLEDFVGEFDAFPNGAHDDIVDSVSQALIAMAPLSPSERFRAQAG